MLSSAARDALLALARQAIEQTITRGSLTFPDLTRLPEEFRSPRDVFVTLHKQRDLRGCTGAVHSTRALAHEVMATAAASASEDPRFSPLTAEEFPSLTIEISILSPFREVHAVDDIIPRKHGVLVQQGLQKGLFLPQVWEETGWDKTRFLNELCQSKAGLTAHAWQIPGTLLYIFEVEAFAAAVMDIGESTAPV